MFSIYTALVTPFKDDFTIDYDALGTIIDDQLLQGCNGFIICGTTAESPVLSKEEKFDILTYVIKKTKHTVPLWFGCGTNNTKETIALCKQAQEYDIDGVLLVTPYYNKPSQEGLYAHFKQIHDETNINMMLYNVPSRTGCEVSYETLFQLLQDCPRIIALKQASSDFDTVKKIMKDRPDFKVFSGEDGSFIEGREYGMCGLISVMSHYNMKDINAYIKHPEKGKKTALYEFAKYCFLQSSPSTIKYMLSKKGLCRETVRLPLVSLNIEYKKIIDIYLKD